LYGDIPWSDMPRVAWLSCTLFFIIGGFWILDSLKDSVFENTVGIEYQPNAKLVSAGVMIFLVAIYSHLVDILEKHQLFYVIGGFYAVIFLVISLLLANSKVGLQNTAIHPRRLIGWISYVAIESYISLAVTLFWSFMNASVDMDEAATAYGLVIAGAEIGALLGSTIAAQVKQIQPTTLYRMAAIPPLLLAGMMWVYAHIWLSKPTVSDVVSHAPVGRKTNGSFQGSTLMKMLDGVKLIIQHHYVFLLLLIECADEIVLSVLDYEMKIVGAARFKGRVDDFTLLLARFGQATNFISLAMSLFGTSYIVRKIGISKTLQIFPAMLMVMVVVGYIFPLLWVLFLCLSILKGLLYSLYEPCIEMLFLPTSDEIKFKCKGWIDAVGARIAKAIGSMIILYYGQNPTKLVTYRGLPSFLISLLLFFLTISAGREFEKLQSTGKIVGESNKTEYCDQQNAPLQSTTLELPSSCQENCKDDIL